MKAIIEIEMDGAAFDGCPGPGLAQILHDLEERSWNTDEFSPGDTFPIMDENGNRVGQMRIEP